MYYYKGEELGGFDVAYDRIYEDRVMRRELMEEFIGTLSEDALRRIVVDTVLSGLPAISLVESVEQALTYMRDAWLDMKEYAMPGSTYDLGDFEYEDWKEVE